MSNEEALASARRLEAAGRLAGGVAHDFNNLLAVIAGNLELAEDRDADEPTRQLIRRARYAAEKGRDLNSRLLSWRANARLRRSTSVSIGASKKRQGFLRAPLASTLRSAWILPPISG
jgi:signal transduction histidine kinase